MKKNNIKTKIIAGILSAITVCSVGTMAIGSASAAVTTDAPVSTGIAGSIAKTAFGYVGKTLLNTTSTRLANMAIGPVFNLIFGTDGGPSNNVMWRVRQTDFMRSSWCERGQVERITYQYALAV